jgi:hypothetical protein
MAAPSATPRDHADGKANQDPLCADVEVKPQRLALGRVRPVQVVRELLDRLGD